MKEDKMNILFDTNVIIDAITDRPDSNEAAKKLFLLAAASKINGYLLSKQITDIYYCVRKYNKDASERKEFIYFLLRSFKIISLEKEDFEKAFEILGPDYEDDLLIHAALKNNIDYIATNNINDFQNVCKIAYEPKELLNILASCK